MGYRVRTKAWRLLPLTVLAACTVGPNFEQPTSFWQPGSWFASRPPAAKPEPSEAIAAPVDPRWWTLLDDPILTALEARVADSNLDVRTATIRLAEARASLGVARADLFPQINNTDSYTRTRVSPKGASSLFGGGGGGSGAGAGGTAGATAGGGATTGGGSAAIPSRGSIPPFDLFQGGFDASWELDLWGRVRRNIESSAAQLEANENARRDTLVTALAELARDYVQLRGAQTTLRITRDNLGSSEQSVTLTRQRAQGGLSSDLDVANAAAQTETTRSQIPGIETQIAQLENAIALLLGEAPDAMHAELDTPEPVPPVPPIVPVGLPADLIRRRPDIRRAEAQLHAATADIGVAVADLYPRFTLSGDVSFQATEFRNLFNLSAVSYSYGPSITLPIFDGGRRRRTIELREAQQQEAALTWQRTVLSALHDVSNALVAYASEQRRREALQGAVRQNRRALGLARERYQQGIDTFLNVLDAQRGLLAAEQQFADSTTVVSTNLVQLYKALGGGWEEFYPDAARTANASR